MKWQSNGARGRGGDVKQASPRIQVIVDRNHNRDIPVCGLLKEVVSEIVQDNNHEEKNLFGKLVREHLMQRLKEHREQRNLLEQLARSSAKQKRRKRKKKKNGKKSNQLESKAEVAGPPGENVAVLPTSAGSIGAANTPGGDERVILHTTHLSSRDDEEEDNDKHKAPPRLDGPTFSADIEAYLGRLFGPQMAESQANQAMNDSNALSPPPREKKNDLASFLQYLGEQTNCQRQPIISMSEVRTYCTSIACHVCRTSVELFLNQIESHRTNLCIPVNREAILASPTNSDSSSTTSQLTIPVLRQEKMDLVTQEYDYEAMEEGKKTPVNGTSTKDDSDQQVPTFQANLQDETMKEQTWTFQSGYTTTTTTATTENLSDQPYRVKATVHDIEHILVDFLLPGALTYDELWGAFVDFDHTEFTTIQQTITDHEERWKNELRSIKEGYDDLVNKFNTTFEGVDFDNVGLKNPPKLIDCDSLTSDLFQRLLSLVQKFQGNSAYCRFDYSDHHVNNNNHTPVNNLSGENSIQMEQLWTYVADTTKAKIQAKQQYEDDLLTLASPPNGDCPRMFVNAHHRSIYRKMVQKKIQSLRTILDNIERISQELVPTADHHESNNNNDHNSSSEAEKQSKPSYITPFRRKRFSYIAFYEFFANRRGICFANIEEILPMDRAGEHLLKEILEWTKTIHRGRLTDVYQQLKRRSQTLMRLLTDFADTFTERFALAEPLLSSLTCTKLRNQFDELQQNLKEARGVISNGSDNETTAAMLEFNGEPNQFLRRMENLLYNAGINALSLWRIIRKYTACDNSNMNSRMAPMMPERLLVWMSEGNNNDDINNNNMNNQHTLPFDYTASNYCQGGGAQRRVTAILAGLLYRYLSKQCLEWHAEMAERELLTTMMDDKAEEGGTSNAKNGKNGSKRKKKREKVASKETLGKEGPILVVKEETQGTTTELVSLVDETTLGNEQIHDDQAQSGNDNNNMLDPLVVSGQEQNVDAPDQPQLNSKPETTTTPTTTTGDDEASEEDIKGDENNLSDQDITFDAHHDTRTLSESQEVTSDDSIGLMDGSSFQTAESYLVGRLLALFDSEGPANISPVVVL